MLEPLRNAALGNRPIVKESNFHVALYASDAMNYQKATDRLLLIVGATNMLLFSAKAMYVFTMMNSILHQIKQRRLTLGLKQNDMMLRVGMSRQQYQRLESKGNPRLDTLELIAKGLNTELMLIPKDKLSAVMAVLELGPKDGTEPSDQQSLNSTTENEKKSLSDDPWQDLLGDD
ncbi:helix-turn-helix transcriptional regulator [Thalassolituus oleivorans]|uniref:helix-turn-helix transcriptional regulator n=1 Tax=Thalassolituus oleivorans TaxID=187493 RepID=UPI00042DC609|nr:helix-turn-helix transcriptional regulator [Thalassolituus oleivorans]AHK15123.1 DNA-binding protein [Thalassolituus oleivorans R6-15]